MSRTARTKEVDFQVWRPPWPFLRAEWDLKEGREGVYRAVFGGEAVCGLGGRGRGAMRLRVLFHTGAMEKGDEEDHRCLLAEWLLTPYLCPHQERSPPFALLTHCLPLSVRPSLLTPPLLHPSPHTQAAAEQRPMTTRE